MRKKEQLVLIKHTFPLLAEDRPGDGKSGPLHGVLQSCGLSVPRPIAETVPDCMISHRQVFTAISGTFTLERCNRSDRKGHEGTKRRVSRNHSVPVLSFFNECSGAKGSVLHLCHLRKAVQAVSLSYKWVIPTYNIERLSLTLRASLELKISEGFGKMQRFSCGFFFYYLHCPHLPLPSVNKTQNKAL